MRPKLPPRRDRKGDVPALAARFLAPGEATTLRDLGNALRSDTTLHATLR